MEKVVASVVGISRRMPSQSTIDQTPGSALQHERRSEFFLSLLLPQPSIQGGTTSLLGRSNRTTVSRGTPLAWCVFGKLQCTGTITWGSPEQGTISNRTEPRRASIVGIDSVEFSPRSTSPQFSWIGSSPSIWSIDMTRAPAALTLSLSSCRRKSCQVKPSWARSSRVTSDKTKVKSSQIRSHRVKSSQVKLGKLRQKRSQVYRTQESSKDDIRRAAKTAETRERSAVELPTSSGDGWVGFCYTVETHDLRASSV